METGAGETEGNRTTYFKHTGGLYVIDPRNFNLKKG